MAKTGDLIVVHMVDPVEAGYRFARKRFSWPLHVTLVAWFSHDDPAVLMSTLKNLASRHRPFTYRVGAREVFGTEKEVPVNLVEESMELTKLHEDIFSTLQASKTTFGNTQYMGNTYRPHITRHEPDNHVAREGSTLQFDEFHLVLLQDYNTCEVVHSFKLG